MNHTLLPNIKIFHYLEEGDFFVEDENYSYICDLLNLEEWNRVVWIGRLFLMDNDFGEHWFDNHDLKEEKKEVARKLGYRHEQIFVLDPSVFTDGKDGPCNTDAFRKQFWTDVLKSLELNLGTLIEKARQVNEYYKNSEALQDEYIEDLEENIMEILQKFAPNYPLPFPKLLSDKGIGKEMINEIAQFLDAGQICYVHKDSKDIKAIIDTNNWAEADLELWDEDIKEVENNADQYWRIEPMRSGEAFGIMEKFAQQVDNDKLSEQLFRALNKRKPFQNFKFIIDNSGDYREQWFAFKQKLYEEYVVNELKYLLSS